MSPVPPPPGAFVPSDDWTDDPSFDLSPNASQLALPASPSPSSSSSHRSSIPRSHTSSPLRQFFSSTGRSSGLKLKHDQKQELDALDDDFDLPEGDLPPLSPRPNHKTKPKTQSRPRSSTSSSSSSLITRTVVGAGPQGVGTITKMGVSSPPTSSGVMAGTVKARARALEKAWEADVDLDELDQAVDKAESVGGTLRSKSSFHGRPLAPPKDMLGADALDDFGDLDDATFKPPKGQLPPKASSSKMGTIRLDKAAGWEKFGSASNRGGSLRIKPSFEGRPLAPINKEQAGADALDDLTDFDEDDATFKPPICKLPIKKASSSKMNTISLESVSRGGTLKLKPSLKGRPLAPPKKEQPGADVLDELDDLDEDDSTFKPFKSQLPPSKSSKSSKMGSIDFDQGWENFGQVAGRRLLSPPRKARPGAEALDDFLDLEDEDQATLKAGATIKALLPPPKGKKQSTSSLPDVPAEDPELEADFAIPLNLTNLALASQPVSKPRRKGPRDSAASTAVSEWDSPGASSAASRKGWGWGSEDSPSGKRKSETSATSVSDGLGENEERKKEDNMMDEEENHESGLVFEPAFFSNDRAKDLNLILDRKRRPQFAPQPQTPPGARRGGDDSFEDGLMLDEPGVELSRHRLRAQKRARDKLPASSTLRKGLQPQPQKTVVKEREKAWEKQREAAWGRNTPVQRERTLSNLGMSLRSHSISTVGRETPRGAEPAVSGREKEAMRSRSGHLHSMLPPPPPPVPTSQPPTPSSSRLRHQKSHYQLGGAPPQSPSLTRKQSLASLQDAIAEKNFGSLDPLPPPPMPTSRYHNSTSRLTMPTSSSRAKIRPPVTSIFPGTSPASSSTSDQKDRDREIRSRMYSTPIPRMVDVPKKSRDYGDGTELDGIDDLRVEEDVREAQRGMAGLGLGKPSRHHEPRTSSHGKEKSEKEERRKKSGGTTTTGLATKKIRRRGAGLIKHLGGADKRKVVGEMIWNPNTLRWEGNEAVLRDFDTISSSRPALITHYTGSSVGVGGLSSPVASVAAAAPRIVKDMQFDPVQMKWVSVHPEDDEPDPFEGMADDEDEETGGGTIRACAGRKYVPVGGSSAGSGSMAASSSTWSHRMASESSMATSTASWEDRASHHVGVAISTELWNECKEAEERHRKEMKGWGLRAPTGSSEIRERERREEKRLWEIRYLAMKS
ncbi:hypothetical protein IAR50_003093 [Cryptococcus sp. DSM 104548]